MVEALAQLLVRRSVAWFVVVLTLVVAGISVALSGTVKQDDDLLAFLPKTDPDIAAFQLINDEFGGTDVAMIAVTAPDVFSGDVLKPLSAATDELAGVAGLEHVLSMTSVPDFRDDPVTGGIITSKLVDAIPANAEQAAALRARILSRDQVVGNLVSEQGDAALVLAFLQPDAQPAPVAEAIRGVMEQHFAPEQVVYGGGPFIGTYIYETTQADMKALTPIAIGVIIVIMMLAFRDPVGTALGLGATSLGIVVSRAAMAVLGVDFNVVLGSMPVILFAVGSAYAIHVLSHYHRHAAVLGPGPDAVVATLKGTGTTVLAAGLTTVAGLLSFVAMDIEPMQTFGLFTALGIFVALLASLIFVPAFLSLFPGKARSVAPGSATRAMTQFAHGLLRHRKAGRVALFAAAAAALVMVGRVDARMDLSAFFEEGSGPDQAQTLLRERFGGSQFLMLKVQADLTSPEVLREVARIQDAMSLIPHVSQVTGAPDLVALVNKAMSGARRIPDTPGQVKVLYRFLDSDPSVSKLVNADRTAGLIQVRIDSDDADDLDAVLLAVETLVAEQAVHTYRVGSAGDDADAVRKRTLHELATGFVALAASYGVDAASAEEQALGFLSEPAPEPPPATVQAGLQRFLRSEESFVVLDDEQAIALSNALAPLAPDVYDPQVVAVMAGALGVEEDDATILDLQVVLDGPWSDIRRAGAGLASAKGLLAATGVQPPAGELGPLFQARLSDRMQDRFNATAILPAAEGPSIGWEVSGMPVLYRGLSRSVTANQFKSLALAMGLVFVIMAGLYRSVATGLLAVSPTLFTLAAIYGAMGAFGVQLDIGTSMLASIIIGAGVDYSVHLLAAWNDGGSGDRAASVTHAIAETSHAIWTNAVMVAAGFFVLTFGQALPLRNVGRLTAAAMLVAAVSTFLILPLLARRLRYRASPDAGRA